jgi:hypothetical protein
MNIKIEETKLGREKAVGKVIPGNGSIIYVDPRQKSKEYLDTIIHESLHLTCPDWTEEKVVSVAKSLTDVVWRAMYRRLYK